MLPIDLNLAALRAQGDSLAELYRGLVPVAPLAIIDGARQWLFGGVVAESPVGSSTVPLPVYGLATAILLLGSWLVLALRYRRITV